MEKQNDNSEFENSKWSLYAEILTELRHKRDQIDMIKDITRTDINLINRVLSGELAMKLQRISVSDKYLKAMSKTRRSRK
jgi:hypothetical protein